MILFLLALLTSIAAQADENTSVLNTIRSNSDLYVTTDFNGPSIGRFGDNPGENYNVFQSGPWPLYLYHTLDFKYHFLPFQNFGMELSAKQDLVSGVRNEYGEISPQFGFYDPQFWYEHSSLVENSWLRLAGQISIFPGVTDYSRENLTKLFSTAFDTTFNFKIKNYSWSAYVFNRIQPTFYRHPQKNGPYDYRRETMFFKVGHFVGYSLSNRFQLTHSSVFDCNHFSDAKSWGDLESSSDDRMKLQLNYFSPGGFLRAGAYLQTLAFQPRLNTSIVGLDLTLNLLQHR
jgi:hypothetical protein